MIKIGIFLIVIIFSFSVVGCNFLDFIKSPPPEEGVTTLSETSGEIVKEVKACSSYTHEEGTLSAKKRIFQRAINDVAPTFGVVVTGKNSMFVNCVKEKSQEVERCIENTILKNEQTIVENVYTIQQVKYPIVDEQRVCVAVRVKKIENQSEESSTSLPKNLPLFDGYQFMIAEEWGKAENKFSQAAAQNPGSAEPLYWQARLALARDRRQISLRYLEEALKSDPSHVHSLALKMKVLLLMGGRYIKPGKKLAESLSAYHPSPALKNWSRCVNKLSGFIITETDIESHCHSQFPVYNFSEKK